ncbi:MAG: hypothetical protein ABH919_01655 [bacterium]
MAERKNLRNIRTLKTDAAETIKQGKVSLSSTYLKQRTNQTINTLTEQKRGVNFKNIFLSFLILLFVSTGGYFTYLFIKEKTVKPTNENNLPPKPILVSQSEIILNGNNKNGLINQIKTELNKLHDAGELAYLPIKSLGTTETYFLSAKNFLEILESRSPVILSTFLEDNFFLGIINLEKNHPLLIFKVKEDGYENVFAGMLRWESFILEDLNFIPSEESGISATSSFKDQIINNQNTRIVENPSDSSPVFIYSLFNKRYLIITDSVKSFEEAINRFVLFKVS